MKKIIAVFLVVFACILTISGSLGFTALSFCEEEINSFVTENGNRTAGSDGEKQSANYIEERLTALNIAPLYESYQQSFEYNDLTSQNVLGLVDNGSTSYVVIGAHYDNIYKLDESVGANDNASGVVTSLNIASNFASKNLDYNIIFAYFGAEEVGLVGSEYFLNNLDENILNNIILYINLDSIGAGDYLYYYTYDAPTSYGNFIDNYASDYSITKLGSKRLFSNRTTQGINYNHIGLNSDNANFIRHGINSLTFFAGNLDVARLGFHETQDHNKIMHNTDSIETNVEVFGERFYINMATVNNFVTDLMLSESFASEMLVREINPTLLTDWFLKIIAIIFVALLALGTFLFFKFKGKKQNPNRQLKRSKISVKEQKEIAEN